MFLPTPTSTTQSFPWANLEGWKSIGGGGWQTPGFVENRITGDKLQIAHIIPIEYRPGLKKLVESFLATSKPPENTVGCPWFNHLRKPRSSEIVRNAAVIPSANLRLGTFQELVNLLEKQGLLNNWQQFPLFPIEYDADAAAKVVEHVLQKSPPQEKFSFIFRKSSADNCIVIMRDSESEISQFRYKIYIDSDNNIYLRSCPQGLTFARLSTILEDHHSRLIPMQQEDVETAIQILLPKHK